MNVRDVKILLLKGFVITMPFGWWSPFPIPYTSITFLFMYVYLGLSFLTFRESFSLALFRLYALPLLVIWVIMLTKTFMFYNVNAESANSVLRQFIFILTSAFEGFGNVLIEAQSFAAIPVCFKLYPVS